MKFSHSFVVKKNHLDEQRHVNNVVYVQWIQDVAVAHWLSVIDEETREKYTWFLLRHEIDYKLQAFESDIITVTTWVGKATRITWERFTEIKRGDDLLIKAKSIWCLIDRNKNKPSRIGKEIKQLLN
jgi:acyl-CoA thioester hydrolase